MTKFELFDIETIKKCIKGYCIATIDDEVNRNTRDGCAEIYRIQQRNIQEAERLIGLMDSLKGENV